MDNLRIALPALIGLIGTLIVAYFGYRQWKRQHALTRAGTLLSEKQSAYKTIWSKLEDVNAYVREEAGRDPLFDDKRFDVARYREAVKTINVEMMKSGLLLNNGDKEVVADYLKALLA